MNNKLTMRYLLFILAIIIFTFTPCKASDISCLISGDLGYDRGVWSSGKSASPTGTMHDRTITYGGSIKLQYRPWKYVPTAELSYHHGRFDFSNSQASVQEANPDKLSFRIGLTRQIKSVSVYGLAGLTIAQNNAELIETVPYLNHGKHGTQDKGFSMKFGAYRLFNVHGIEIGPEIYCEIYPKPLGFERCRNFKTGVIHSGIGVIIRIM